jgi:hypothetical protein
MMMAALTGRPPGPSRNAPDPDQKPPPLERRLTDEFADLAPHAVARCVADVSACVTHLGMEPTPDVVERIAREHLVGMVKSQPPSGR